MRVVIASNFPRDDRLGTSRTPLRLAAELAALGVQVDTVFAEDLPRVRGGRVDQLTAPFRMAALLVGRAREADVVDIAGFDAWAYARFARRRRPGQALVSRSNGLWYRALAAGGAPPTTFARRVASRLYQDQVFRRWERASMIQCDVALFLCQSDAREIVRNGWKTDEGAAFVHPAVDDFFASPVPLADRRDVAFVGTFFERKGSDVVGQAMSRVMRARPSLGLSLFGTGLGEPEVRAAFDPDVRSRVTVAPPLSPRELAEHLSRFAILLFPTRYEGFGIVVVEAMRAGLAVVTTPTGAGADLIRDGENGLLVPIGAVDETAAAVARLVDDPGLRLRLAGAAIQDSAGCTWSRAAHEVLAVYERARALAARRSPLAPPRPSS